MSGSSRELDKKKLEEIQEALELLNKEIDGREFVAGEKITIADYSLIATISTMRETGIDISGYINIVNWADKCAVQMPGYDEVNAPGAKQFGAYIRSKLNSSGD